MSDLSKIIKPLPPLDLSPAAIEAIRARIADGVFLGGDYAAAYNEFLIAHRDRMTLLALVDRLQATAQPKEAP